MSSPIAIYTPIDGNRTVDAVWVLCYGGLAQHATNYYTAAIYVAGDDGYAHSIATYSQATTNVGASGRLLITSSARLGYRIPYPGLVTVGTGKAGTPASTSSVCVQVLIGTTVRTPVHRTGDNSALDASDALAAYARSAGLGQQIITIPIQLL